MLDKKKTASLYYRRKRSNIAERGGFFEASSIGDLAFLLLIFFIVTSSFILRQGVFLSLPSDSASVKVDEKNLLSVYPETQGYTVEGKFLDREGLLAQIRERREQSRDTIMVIYMKPDVKYDRLVDTLSAAKEEKLKKISLKNIAR